MDNRTGVQWGRVRRVDLEVESLWLWLFSGQRRDGRLLAVSGVQTRNVQKVTRGQVKKYQMVVG